MTGPIVMASDEPDAREWFRQNFRREIRKGVYAFDLALSGSVAILRNHCPTLRRQMINGILNRR